MILKIEKKYHRDFQGTHIIKSCRLHFAADIKGDEEQIDTLHTL